MGLFILYSYSLLCWIILCCILCLPLYLPSSLSRSSILFLVPVVFLVPLVSTRHPALHLRFPGGSSPACPTPFRSALLIACTPPASPVSRIPHSSSDPFVETLFVYETPPGWSATSLLVLCCGYWVLHHKDS